MPHAGAPTTRAAAAAVIPTSMLDVPPVPPSRGASAPPDAPRDGGTGTLAWVGPFAVFMAWLAIDKFVPIANPAKELVRDAVLLAAIVGFSRRLLPRSAPHWIGSVVLGVVVGAL